MIHVYVVYVGVIYVRLYRHIRVVVDVYNGNAKAVGVHIYVTEICIVKAGK